MYEDVKFGWQMFGLNKELELAQEGTDTNMDTPSNFFFFYLKKYVLQLVSQYLVSVLNRYPALSKIFQGVVQSILGYTNLELVLF